jgi:hypothetical protein
MIRRFAVFGLFVLALTSVAPPPAAHASVAKDISYPQCAVRLPPPTRAAFAVIGANDGRAFTTNPCLESQLRWAKTLPGPPAFYANTGDPGPRRAHHWPRGQPWPFPCHAWDPNLPACSFDYGWNAARQSFSAAARAAMRLHHVTLANAVARAANVDWWLDVELTNTWLTLIGRPTGAAQVRDALAVLGEREALRNLGVRRVGVYSTRFQWMVITGHTRLVRGWFAETPVWLAGFASHDTALFGCFAPSFTGGPVIMTQYLGPDGFDSDVACR